MLLSQCNVDVLIDYTQKQLNNFFPDGQDTKALFEYRNEVIDALDRVEYCFKHVKLKNYYDGKDVKFDYLYSGHYLMYLWFLANTIYKSKNNARTIDKLYYLNKALNGVDIMYNTELPDIFLVIHGVGIMLGKAKYSNYFVAYQGCTIGANKGTYPNIGEFVSVGPNSSIIGDCNIGSNVSIGANTSIFELNIKCQNNVYRDKKTGEIIILPNSNEPYAKQIFFK